MSEHLSGDIAAYLIITLCVQRAPTRGLEHASPGRSSAIEHPIAFLPVSPSPRARTYVTGAREAGRALGAWRCPRRKQPSGSRAPHSAQWRAPCEAPNPLPPVNDVQACRAPRKSAHRSQRPAPGALPERSCPAVSSLLSPRRLPSADVTRVTGWGACAPPFAAQPRPYRTHCAHGSIDCGDIG